MPSFHLLSVSIITGPGASQTKAKVASGTTGRTTGVTEYQLNLDVALKLRDELEARGYEVYMIRETNDVDISNAERAQLAAESGSDILEIGRASCRERV